MVSVVLCYSSKTDRASKLPQAATNQICMLEVPRSNLDQNINHSERIFVFFLSSSSHVPGYYLYRSHNRILSDSYLTVIVIPHCHRHTTSMLLPESLNEPYINGDVRNIHGNMKAVNPGNDETGKPRGRTTRVEEDKEIASEQRRRSDAPCDWPTTLGCAL